MPAPTLDRAPATGTPSPGRRAAALVVAAVALGVTALALLVRSPTAPLAELDARVSATAEGWSGSAATSAAQQLTHLGDPLAMTVAAAVLALALAARGAWRLVALVVVARLGAVVLSSGLKALVGRVRPLWDEPVATAAGASFPSGHALAAAASWASLAVVLVAVARPPRALLLVLAVGVPVVVAATRVLLGVHFGSDVVAGLLLGWGWTAACALGLGVTRAGPRRRTASS